VDTVDLRALACETQRRWHWFQDEIKDGQIVATRHLHCRYCGLVWTYGGEPRFNGVQILGPWANRDGWTVWIFRKDTAQLENIEGAIFREEGYDELPDGTR